MRESDQRIRPSGTMFAALYGELAFHPWRDPSVALSDPYSLFFARSSAMRWLTEAAENASGGVWAMNDAGQDPKSGSQPSRIIWFQVSLTEPVPANQPLPLQAFLSCVNDVVARIGSLHMQAVQILLPVQSLDISAGISSRSNAVMNLIQEAGWFTDCNPRSKAQVRVTLDSGQDPTIHSAASAILRWLRELKQDVFSCEFFSLMDEYDLMLNPAVINELWFGPAYHRATFHGTLTEWSLDALGWLAALLADASFQNGVSTPLMLTATRSQSPTQYPIS